jgi:hypothetical protein
MKAKLEFSSNRKYLELARAVELHKIKLKTTFKEISRLE